MHYQPFWYGFTNFVLCTSFLIITILVTLAIRCHECYSKWSSYQIMFYISLCDIAQLTAQQFSGVALMLQWDMPDLLNMFLGSVISGTWIPTNIYGILLAVQRLLSVVFPIYEMNNFTKKRKTIIFAIAHSTIPILTVLQWTNWSRIKFFREDFSWHYDNSLPFSYVFSFIDSYSVIPFILCSFACYSMIFYTIKTKGSNKKMESAITMTVFLYCFFCALIFILWRFVEPFFKPEPIVFFWTNLPLIMYNGANGVICICFNRSIRSNVLKLLHCRPSNEQQRSQKLFEKSKAGPRTSWTDSIKIIYKISRANSLANWNTTRTIVKSF